LGPHSHNDGFDVKYDKRIKPSAVTLNGDFISPSPLSSIDNGRGHVAAIRAAGITHVCLGNHEADIPLNVLKERLDDLAKGKRIVVLNSNVRGLGRHSRELDVVSSGCGQIKVGLLGLLSDEDGMFRDGTFKGLHIDDVKKKYEVLLEKVHTTMAADCLVPLTHQTLKADIELAKWMFRLQSRHSGKKRHLVGGIILGGHEHTKIHEHVLLSDDKLRANGIQIVKTGMNSDRAAVIDLHFNPSTHILLNTNVHFEELDERHPPCPIVNTIVKKHLSALDELQDFVVFDSKSMLSEFFNEQSTGKHLPLSSVSTRYEQTTVGAFFCTAVKSELGADVCIINGAPIKASKVYTGGTMSYDELRNELPFPLKMVVVEMTRKQLRDAIHFSRTNVEEGKVSEKRNDGNIERRGFLQTDFDYWMRPCNDSGRDDEILTVALPRNLLGGKWWDYMLKGTKTNNSPSF
jgi:5'-nucleotidase